MEEWIGSELKNGDRGEVEETVCEVKDWRVLEMRVVYGDHDCGRQFHDFGLRRTMIIR